MHSCMQSTMSLVYVLVLQQSLITVSDIDDCISQPCWNGRCVDAVNGYTCDCDAGYTGVFCETSKFQKFYMYLD